MNSEEGHRTSLGKFSYALRPAKNIERKMLCEAFACLASIAPLRKYRYIGFGSIEFVDFALIHQRLGIKDMVSVECKEEAKRRVEFNRPYSWIVVKWGTSGVVLTELDWRKKTIVWLDYDRPLDLEILEDIRLVVSSLVSGSMIVVTVDAKPQEVEGDPRIGQKRLQALVQNVGRSRLPTIQSATGQARDVKGSDLAGWGLAKTYRQIIHNEVAKTLADRNGPLNGRWKLSYKQLFNFHYADGAKMLTVGGSVLHSQHESKMPASTFESLEFVRTGSEPYLIESPVLTLRELRYLDNHLTSTGFKGDFHRWLPKAESQKYRKVYRYYPAFAEIEA